MEAPLPPILLLLGASAKTWGVVVESLFGALDDLDDRNASDKETRHLPQFVTDQLPLYSWNLDLGIFLA